MSEDVDPFYLDVLESLKGKGWLSIGDSVLVVCGGGLDRSVWLAASFTKVTISNLDERMTGHEYAPFEWLFVDSEKIDRPDESFDWVVVHSGLHHCYSPHRAIAEMWRVARKGVIGFEPRDGWYPRLGVRLGFGQQYEHAAVFYNGMDYGGVANTAIPNYVYRFSERELAQTIACLDPTRVHEFYFKHTTRIPWARLEGLSNPLFRFSAKALKPVLILLSRCKWFANNIAFAARKGSVETDLHPWLEASDAGAVQPNHDWFKQTYS